MNVVIVGYGQMGKEVERICLDRGHKVIAKVDARPGVGDFVKLDSSFVKEADVAIEFSLAEAVAENVKFYAEHKLPVVIGTTGWLDQLKNVEETINRHQGTLLYGSNFSIGAHLFFHLVEKAAALINPVPDYDIMVTEYHHSKKQDSPSGTAITTAERILNANDRKTTIQPEKLNRQIKPEELHVASVRGGSIPGIHSVLLDSPFDSIEISHTARTRAGFALGSVLAGEWLNNKTGFYSVDEFIADFLK